MSNNPLYAKALMWCDLQEVVDGDGYFPLTYKENIHMKDTHETFYFCEGCVWKQLNINSSRNVYTKGIPGQGLQHFHSIKGLDGNEGEKLLTILNEQSKRIQLENLALHNQLTVKLCINRLKKQGIYESVILKTPLINELEKPMFVFMVLEMMHMCGMKLLADEVVSYIGVTSNDNVFKGTQIVNYYNKQLYPKVNYYIHEWGGDW
jgi:hypothetical protein